MPNQLDSFSTFAARRSILQQLRTGVSIVLRDGLGTYAAELRVIPTEGALVLGGEGPEGLCGAEEVRIEFADISVLAVDTIRNERCLRLDTVLADQFYISPMDGGCAVPSADDIAETLSKLVERSGGVASSSSVGGGDRMSTRDPQSADVSYLYSTGDLPPSTTTDNQATSSSIAEELRNLYTLIEEKNRVVSLLADAVASLQQSFQTHQLSVGLGAAAGSHGADRPGTAAHLTGSTTRASDTYSPADYDLQVVETDNIGEVIEGGDAAIERDSSRDQRQRPLTAGGILRHPSTLVVSFEGELDGHGTTSSLAASSSSNTSVDTDEEVVDEDTPAPQPQHVDPMTRLGLVPNASNRDVPRDGTERQGRSQFVGSRHNQSHQQQHHRRPTHQGDGGREGAIQRPVEGDQVRRGPGIGDLGDDVLERVREAALGGGGHEDVDDHLMAAYRDIHGSASSSDEEDSD